MAHPAARLREGEQVILDTRPHWWYFARPIAILLASIFFGIAVLITIGSKTQPEGSENLFDASTFTKYIQMGTGLVILLSVGILILSIASWYFTHFFVTTDRIVLRSGVLNRRGAEIPIERINTVFYEQNLIERFVGAGDILVESAGESGAQRFFDIANPLAVQEKVRQQIENHQAKMAQGGHGEDHTNHIQAPEIPDRSSNLTKEITVLSDLHKDGILTKEEYQTKKAEILRRF